LTSDVGETLRQLVWEQTFDPQNDYLHELHIKDNKEDHFPLHGDRGEDPSETQTTGAISARSLRRGFKEGQQAPGTCVQIFSIRTAVP
jgi:hypothetical protein